MKFISQLQQMIRVGWHRAGGGWKILLFVWVLLLSLIVLASLLVWATGKSIGRVRNLDLYLPRMGSKR